MWCVLDKVMVSEKRGDVPDWLADLVPKPSGIFPGASLPSGAAKPLEVPQSLVPMLTESLIQRISGDSGASIILRQDTRNLGYSLVLFSGPNQATQQAREMVQKYCGLTTGPNITKTIELYTYHSSAFYAMDEAMKDFKNKVAGLSIKLIPPETLGAPFKATIRKTLREVELELCLDLATIRKTLREVELELHYKQRRTVPPELKHAMMCKNTKDGIDCPNKACPFCHSVEELEIASRCCFENISISGQATLGNATVQRPAPVKAPPIITARAVQAKTTEKGDPQESTAKKPDNETSGLL
ncbi:hypothetical protein AK812_SmicGene2555 [Symbiodinium microadriaticum]|uniref:Uncharacterized protein n=1 Tax=Symbiodinium microadriaticum TaxID=2951 RepID=A0A1Q9F1A4_SYMMI|nr:hypothetical protein AK812_SmicGene2555 [Symbiodinium microadriaticum]